MPSPERTPQERETLIFSQPEAAQQFREAVNERLAEPGLKGVDSRREVVANALASQFQQQGEGVSMIRHPWEHTPAEHAEAQALVDVAFAKDLSAALRQARKSPHYPRNVDLFHDVLTGEMYQLLAKSGLDRQPLLPWVMAISIVVAGTVLLIAILVILL